MNISKQHQVVIKIPEKVTITKTNDVLNFYGPLGQTGLNLKKIDPVGLGGISLDTKNNLIKFTTPSKSFFGLFRALVNNKIQGVSRGFLVYLKIIGIGYRASLENQTLILKLGFSDDLVYKIPASIRLFLIEPTVICLFGLDKNQITQIAAKIRHLRRPSVYKGKGIRLIDEKIVLKAGKKK